METPRRIHNLHSSNISLTMLHPIQRICACTASIARIYTATSNVLHAFDATTGDLLASWTAPIVPPQGTTTAKNNSPNVEDDAPQSKKRKFEGETDPSTKKGKGGVRMSRLTATEGGSNNAISALLTTRDGTHLVVATSEDKAVRVFSVAEGKLELLSTRALPKRVGGLAFLENDTKLVVADKHGDVFLMPLIITEMPSPVEKPQDPAGSGQLPAGPERDAEAARRRARTEIDYNLPYEHKFIIGHVSMLLAVYPVSLPADHPAAAGKAKNWIITADRDEHIRVTRYPQTFVIDQFLLGHESFVAKLLSPSWNRTGLISGGGDTYLVEWDWLSGRRVQRIDLASHVHSVLAKSTLSGDTEPMSVSTTEPGAFKIAVNGLWELPHPNVKGVLVGVEKVPALFIFTQSSAGLAYTSKIPLTGNLLDVAVIAPENRILVAMCPLQGPSTLLQAYEFTSEGAWAKVEHPVVQSVSDAVTTVNVPEHLEEAVRANVLYSVGTLRKEFSEGDNRNRGTPNEQD
ncbi:hypothetical protein EDC01DRAFT_649584 [Geopyxis carbonaria]|nr:hypothetical protein EDC01DRAFT_649584 [Geopyxis carbonaria]